MHRAKSTFALFFGTRALFPSSLITGARQELATVLKEWGHETLLLDEHATRHGAVETTREGQVYADFLQANRGKFDGVIVCLANFGDETGAVAAIKDAGVPILVQAYPDEPDKMAAHLRRDAYCGKLSIMDVFCQYGVPFTALPPHTVHLTSPRFRDNVEYFDRVCKVVNGVRGMTVGAIGARTTPFKTVRIDELALQKHGITVETLDLSSIIARAKELSATDTAMKAKADHLRPYTGWDSVPDRAFENLCRLAVVFDQVSEEYQLDALAIRCWTELQQQLGITPCVAMALLNETGRAAACEVDVGNAILMQAFGLASGEPVAVLDWNNNYGDEDNKCILFHCSAVPTKLMRGANAISGGGSGAARGGCASTKRDGGASPTIAPHVEDHPMLARVVGAGNSFGCNAGRLAATPFTFGSLLTRDGRIHCYLGEGRITDDPIAPDFFGCGGVAEIDHLQDVLLHVGRHGHRHHVSVTPGHLQAPIHEALERYLNFDVVAPQRTHGILNS
ncbi:MAG: hypothetical protein AB1716_12750 [Planctomycetota bacterium]